MSRYFEVVRPAEQTIPVLVDVPHAGEWIPEELLTEMPVEGKTLRRDLDLYVDQIWDRSPEFGATLIYSKVSRYVVDLNRAADDVSPKTVLGAKRIDAPGYYHDRGVVWRTTTDGIPVLSGPMTQDAFARRIETFHTPYHTAIRTEIDRIRDQFGYCILIDGHSMPSMGRSGHTDPGSRRADIVPGDVEGTSCADAVRMTVESHFRSNGYSVATNKPYKGGWITRHFGEPEENVHAIQIEVNRDVYMNEKTFKIREKNMARLNDVCSALVELMGTLKL